MSASTKRVAVLPGDDAAPEAVHPTLDMLRSMGLPIDWVLLPDGEALAATAREERERRLRDAVDGCDTALFGATSGKTGGVGYLRWGKQTYANVRPIRWRPGASSPLDAPERIDYVIVRENLEDVYLGLEGELAELAAAGLDLRPWRGLVGAPAPSGEARYAVKVVSRGNTERLAEFACRLALARRERGGPGTVTCGSKHNVLPRTDGLFRRTVAEVVARHPELTYDEYLADDLARRLVASPHQFDVIVLPNLYGDILSDVGAATIGGLGLAPSGCYGDSFAYFEPVHGTAPDIAGCRAINPTATILSAAMMLDYLGFAEAAQALERAVDGTLAAGDRLTPDQGGSASTDEFVQAVRSRL